MLTSMFGGKTRLLKQFIATLVCLVFLTLSPGVKAAPDKPAYPQGVVPGAEALLPKDKLYKDEVDSVADRKKILTELYHRLRKAEDEATAAIVASAIEKLWLHSGSATVDLLMDRVGVLMEDEEFDIALKLLNSVIEIAPAYSEGWNRRAALFFVKKDFARSLDDLRHALALDPSHFKAIQGLGLLMQELGDKEAALKAFRQALKVHPHLEELRQSEQELSREVEGQGI